MKRSLKKSMVNKLTQVQHDAPFLRSHETLACHPEFNSGSRQEMLKRVQHDISHFSPSGQRGQGELTLQDGQSTLPNPLCPERENPFYRPHETLACHPEFISGSRQEMLKRVQHDKRGRHSETPTRHPEFSSGSQIQPQVQYDASFSLHDKLCARKIFARSRPQFKKQFAFGRSMMEMLGVLAIIGVLSIGAFYGLRQAVIKIQANRVVADVKVAGFLLTDGLLAQMQPKESLVMSKSFFQPESDYNFSALKIDEKSYQINVSFLSERLCSEIVKYPLEWVEAITANNRSGCLDIDENVVEFYFNTAFDNTIQNEDLKSCQTDVDCGRECGRCVNKVCYDDSSLCSGGTPNCVSGECSMCPTGQFESLGTCVDCSKSTYLLKIAASESECNKCSNRIFMFNYCWLCANGKKNAEGNGCTCPDGQFFNLSGAGNQPACTSCNEEGGRAVANESDCLACPERWMRPSEKNCLPCSFFKVETMQLSSRESCLNCSGTMWANDYCSRCIGTLNGDRSACTCDEGYFFANHLRKIPVCIACDSTNVQGYTTLEECLRCPHRYLNAHGNCIRCDGTVSSDGKSCECGDGFFKDTEGACYSCNHVQAHSSWEAECSRCSNRYMSANSCTLKPTCQEGEFILGDKCLVCPSPGVVSEDKMACLNACGAGQLLSNGRSSDKAVCVSCDIVDYFRTTLEESLKCPNRYFGSYNNSRSCDGVVSSDGKSCDCSEAGVVNNGDFGCLSCERVFWEKRARITQADCSKCPNTWYDGSYCYGCDTYAPTTITTEALCTGCGYTWASNSCS